MRIYYESHPAHYNSYGSSLAHHGILGQRWGIRRFQNEDGSLTEAGKKRYYDSYGNLTKKGEKEYREQHDKNITKLIEKENEWVKKVEENRKNFQVELTSLNNQELKDLNKFELDSYGGDAYYLKGNPKSGKPNVIVDNARYSNFTEYRKSYKTELAYAIKQSNQLMKNGMEKLFLRNSREKTRKCESW